MNEDMNKRVAEIRKELSPSIRQNQKVKDMNVKDMVFHELAISLLSVVDSIKAETRFDRFDAALEEYRRRTVVPLESKIKEMAGLILDKQSEVSSLESALTKESTVFAEERKRAIRLEAENSKLKIDVKAWMGGKRDQDRNVNSLLGSLKEAEKGLDYYADEKMYEKDSDGDIPLMVDCGPIFAQRILKSIRGES